MAAPPTLESLPLEIYWRLLDTPSLLRLSAASQALRARVASTKWLIPQLLSRDFSAPAPPSSPPSAWLSHLRHFSPAAPASACAAVARRVVPRAAAVWAGLRAFCASHALPLPLLPPADPGAVAALEARLGVAFPHALRALLCAHEGQRPQSHWGGALGGAAVYHLRCTTFLCPGGLRDIERVTRSLREQAPHFPRCLVPIAMGGPSIFVLDCGAGPARGMVWRVIRHALEPAAAGAAPLGAASRLGSEGPFEDAVLQWLEEWVARLAAGAHEVECVEGAGEEDHEPSSAGSGSGGGGAGGGAMAAEGAPPGQEEEEEEEEAPRFISAFSTGLRSGSHAVTHGVHVHVSSLPISVYSTPPAWRVVPFAEYDARCALLLQGAAAAPPAVEASPEYEMVYAYKVSMWREADAPAAHEGEYGRLKLTKRLWNSQEAGAAGVSQMGGPGVIGLHPVLARGGRKFYYCS